MSITLPFWSFATTWKRKEVETRANFFEMKDIGLTSEDIDNIKAVFSKYSQVEKVPIYGSRAKGTISLPQISTSP